MSVDLEKMVKSGRKPKGDGHLRRAEILAAAEKLFLREGYQGATIRKIAQEVGLSSTALYMHFCDKSEILAEICVRTFDRLRLMNEEIDAEGLAPRACMRRLLIAYMDFALENPNAYLVVFERSTDVMSHGVKPIDTLGAQAAAPFHAAIEAVHQTTPLRCTPEEATQICWSACHGLASLRINHPNMEWQASSAAMAENLVDTLLKGILAD